MGIAGMGLGAMGGWGWTLAQFGAPPTADTWQA